MTEEDYPLPLLVTVKRSLLRVCEDPTLEDARSILDVITSWNASHQPLADDATVERIARILDPSSWAVMDGYLAETQRKYRGQNVGWPADQFKHKESMATARKVLAAIAAMREDG